MRGLNHAAIQKIDEHLVVIAAQHGPWPPLCLTRHKTVDHGPAIRPPIHQITQKYDLRVFPTIASNPVKRIFEQGILPVNIGNGINRFSHGAVEPLCAADVQRFPLGLQDAGQTLAQPTMGGIIFRPDMPHHRHLGRGRWIRQGVHSQTLTRGQMLGQGPWQYRHQRSAPQEGRKRMQIRQSDHRPPVPIAGGSDTIRTRQFCHQVWRERVTGGNPCRGQTRMIGPRQHHRTRAIERLCRRPIRQVAHRAKRHISALEQKRFSGISAGHCRTKKSDAWRLGSQIRHQLGQEMRTPEFRPQDMEMPFGPSRIKARWTCQQRFGFGENGPYGLGEGLRIICWYQMPSFTQKKRIIQRLSQPPKGRRHGWLGKAHLLRCNGRGTGDKQRVEYAQKVQVKLCKIHRVQDSLSGRFS